MAKYLVTGGCGFIGSHLIESLTADGHEVRVVDDLSTGKRENIAPDIELIEGCVSNQAVMEKALEGVDGCFHLAAVVSVTQSVKEWKWTHQVNASATVNIFDIISKKSKKIPVVFASSAAIYGENTNTPLKESETATPISAYGADKFTCELHGSVASAIHGIPAIGLRFFNVYGPRQDPKSPYSGVISIFMDKIRAGDAVQVFGDGGQKRDFVYVKDVASALRGSMGKLETEENQWNVFNVCTGKMTTITELAKVIESVTEKNVEHQYLDAKPGDIYISGGNPEKLNKVLKVTAKHTLHEGLTHTLKSFS